MEERRGMRVCGDGWGSQDFLPIIAALIWRAGGALRRSGRGSYV
jgi:hypothetical protein